MLEKKLFIISSHSKVISIHLTVFEGHSSSSCHYLILICLPFYLLKKKHTNSLILFETNKLLSLFYFSLNRLQVFLQPIKMKIFVNFTLFFRPQETNLRSIDVVQPEKKFFNDEKLNLIFNQKIFHDFSSDLSK